MAKKQIHELTALPVTPATGQVFAVDTGTNTYKIDYNTLATAILSKLGAPITVANGGTGQTSLKALRNAMGLGNTDGVLPVANGGTGRANLQDLRLDMGLGDTTGALPIANGGTGQTANIMMLTNLSSTSSANILQAAPRPGVTGTLGVANGGTGGTTKLAARKNLGIQSGKITGSSVSSNNYKDYEVAFDVAFSSVPNVVVGFDQDNTQGAMGSCACGVVTGSVSVSGFTARVWNASSGAKGPNLQWIAVG